MAKTTLNIIAKYNHYSEQDEDKSLDIIFIKGKEYQAKIVADDNILVVGEDGEERRVGGDLNGKPYWRDWDFLKSFEMIDPPVTCIETEVYEPIPEKPGFVREVRKRTFGEIYKETRQFLEERDIWDSLDYFHLSRDYKDDKFEDKLFPNWRWIACYAVVGGSEGHYIHVDIIDMDGKTTQLFLGKTFMGMDYALYVSNMLTKVFWDEYKKCEASPLVD